MVFVVGIGKDREIQAPCAADWDAECATALKKSGHSSNYYVEGFYII